MTVGVVSPNKQKAIPTVYFIKQNLNWTNELPDTTQNKSTLQD